MTHACIIELVFCCVNKHGSNHLKTVHIIYDANLRPWSRAVMKALDAFGLQVHALLSLEFMQRRAPAFALQRPRDTIEN